MAHGVDWAKANSLAQSNLARVDAVDAYWRHLNRSISCRALFEKCLQRYGRDEAWQRLIALYAEQFVDWDDQEIAEELIFLLEEAARLDPKPAQDHALPRQGI